jgi:hypothetical protein
MISTNKKEEPKKGLFQSFNDQNFEEELKRRLMQFKKKKLKLILKQMAS